MEHLRVGGHVSPGIGVPRLGDARGVAIRARGLGKRIEERQILKGVELEIRSGEFVALLGANGAGKSTLLKILSTLGHATEGTLELVGMAVGTSGGGWVRRKVGLIGHQTMLYHDLSAVENLEFFGRLYGVKEPRKRAMELLTKLGLKDRAHDAVRGFSRGMAQRVGIARALMHDPEILLADEPFAGLDAPSMAMLERVLAELNGAGKTIVLANHDIRQSLRLSQRVIMLMKGKKVMDEAEAELEVEAVLALMEGRTSQKPEVRSEKFPEYPKHVATNHETPQQKTVARASVVGQVLALVKKDLRIEGRTRQTMGMVVLLGILIVTVLGLALGPLGGTSDDARRTVAMLTPAILWVAYLFAGVLCFEKTMALEQKDGALAGLLLAPLDRACIYAAKLASNLVMMFCAAAVITPVGVLFFAFDLTPGLSGFVSVMALSMVGFAAIGTLFSALVNSTKLQGGMLSLVVFPLILPLVIASTQQVMRMFSVNGAPGGTGLAILVAFDAVFLMVSWIVFEMVLEP